jgi:hypothetical protein
VNYGPCEWFVALPNYGSGAIGAHGLPDRTGGESQFLASLAFLYCSGAKDPLSGGPGGSAIITFREGYTLGGTGGGPGAAPNGTEVAVFSITGMPANTGAGGFFTNAICYFFGLDTGHPTSVLHDGPMGYSWEFADIGPDGVLAATFPWLACVQSCTGPGPDLTGGMQDFVDQYCPKGTLKSTFTFGTFGGTSNYFTSISMSIQEAERVDSSSAFYNGTGANPTRLTATGVGPILGKLWGIDVDCSGADPAKSVIIDIDFAPLPPFSTKYGEKHVGTFPGAYVTFVIPHGGSVAHLGPFPLPLDLTYYNSCWRVQSLCGDTPKAFLTNSWDQTLGSH